MFRGLPIDFITSNHAVIKVASDEVITTHFHMNEWFYVSRINEWLYVPISHLDDGEIHIPRPCISFTQFREFIDICAKQLKGHLFRFEDDVFISSLDLKDSLPPYLLTGNGVKAETIPEVTSYLKEDFPWVYPTPKIIKHN